MFALEGIKVVEFCEIAAGPFCAMLLADSGADVIKVERAAGDAMRMWPPVNEGFSENFASVNRNKRSVVLDLKSEDGMTAAKALILDSDVVLENFRPGVMQRLGLDYATMSAQKPELIYCSISAFGQTGPRSKQGGFDLTMQAMAGVMSVTGEPGGAPVKCGVPLCDFVSALYGAYGISNAIVERSRTAKGQHIDVAMLGATLGIAALQTSEYFGTGKDPKKLGSAHPRNAPYQAFQAQDGYFGMAAGNNNLWHSVCDVVERDDLKQDERFLNPTLRAQNQVELKDILEVVFSQDSVGHWLEEFNTVGVPCSPINTYSQALTDPQVEHMGWVQDLTLVNGLTTKTFGSPLRINDETTPLRMRPPGLGEHTDEVLAELDLSSEVVAKDRTDAEVVTTENVLLVDQQADVLTLTLNRPDSANALSPELVEALLAQITQANGVRLCVIRAAGRNFCSGFDLSGLERLSDGDLLLRFLRVETLLQAVHHAPFPVVALVQGHAMGAGADLFAACWQRIATPKAKFRMPGWQFELALGTRRLTRLMGSDAARDMLIDSKTVLADAGLATGLVSEVAELEQWEAKVAALAERARSLPENALPQMLALTLHDSCSEDMAAIVATAGNPGLRQRILDYIQASRSNLRR